MDKKYILFQFGEHFVAGEKVKILLRDMYVAEEEIQDRIKVIEEGLKSSDYFNGCDFNKHVDIISGKENYLNGVVFTDVMGQQILEVLPLTEQEMMDTIIKEFDEQNVNDVLELPDMEPTLWDENSPLTYYVPRTIVKRTEDKETIYDVECETTNEIGESGPYFVESLEIIGYSILFNIYLSITRK